MNFLNQSLKMDRTFEPIIKTKEWPNISVVPYVHNRLIFSRLVSEALKNKRFETVITDLPRFMQANEWVDRPIRHYPQLLTYHFEYEKLYYYYTFAPNDAPAAALILARKNNINYYCIDDPVYLYHNPTDFFNPYIKMKDENFIYQDGIADYYKKPWQHLFRLWEKTDTYQKSLTLSRACTIVERLRQLAEQDKQTLFVCEYRMWWVICKVLQGVDSEPFPQSYPFIFEDINFAVSSEDPYLLWAKSELDDFPVIVHDFYKSIMDDNSPGSTSLQELDQQLSHFFLDRQQAEEDKVSPRRILKFKQYLQNLMLLDRRIMPLPAKHLLHAAQSCFGKTITELLTRQLLFYPLPDTDIEDRNLMFFKFLDHTFEFFDSDMEMPDILDAVAYYENLLDETYSGDASESLKERTKWIDNIHTYMTGQEREEFKQRYSQRRWDVSVEKKLYYGICTNIREMLRRKQDIFITKKCSGSLKDGIDWKATISSMARKENTLYIKENIPKTRNQVETSPYSPIVFIFSKEKTRGYYSSVREENITRRMNGLNMPFDRNKRYPDPKVIYASFRRVYQSSYFLGGHITREKMSALAFNSVSKYLEFNRYYEVDARPERFLARIDPEQDIDIRDINGHDRIVAWTVKYAEYSTIVFAYKGWQPSSHLLDFAKKRNINILIKPISTFSSELVDRLSTCHFISGTLKKHKNREQILRRFIK